MRGNPSPSSSSQIKRLGCCCWLSRPCVGAPQGQSWGQFGDENTCEFNGVALAINSKWRVYRGGADVAGRRGSADSRISSMPAQSYSDVFDLISKQQRGRCARAQHS
jgi:hypothetical protein